MKEEIIKLRSRGLSYRQIESQLGCSRSLISYHCGKGQKEKFAARRDNYRQTQHPFSRKLETFISKEQKFTTRVLKSNTLHRVLYKKIHSFCRTRDINQMSEKPSFTVQDVITKFTTTPKCYLTGKSIDINETDSYHFDHIIPVSKGGTNSIDNLGLCTKEANMAKSNLSLDEFYQLCKSVVQNLENQ